MYIVSAVTSLTAFLIASGLMVFGFKDSVSRRVSTRLGNGFFLLGAITATICAVTHGSSAMDLAATIAWATIIGRIIWRIELVVAFTSPVIAVTQLCAVFFSETHSVMPPGEMGPGMTVHIGAAILGQAFAVLACGLSLLFLWLNQKLKRRQISDLPVGFPAMATLTKALTLSLWGGFIFITISLATGSIYALWGLIPPSQNILPKVAWAILVWVWYLAILVLQGILGYRPHKVAKMSLVGFFIMAISWFGLLFFVPWAHL